MKRFEIYPHVGIGPIKFGATRNSVREALAAESVALRTARDSQDFFFGDASIQVEYEDDGTASFIGVSSHKGLSLIFRGVDLFDTDAPAVFELFAHTDSSGAHSFSPLEYTFPRQILTLYEADAQYDCRGGGTRCVWGQIGAGDGRFLDAILKIRSGVLNRPSPKKT